MQVILNKRFSLSSQAVVGAEGWEKCWCGLLQQAAQQLSVSLNTNHRNHLARPSLNSFFELQRRNPTPLGDLRIHAAYRNAELISRGGKQRIQPTTRRLSRQNVTNLLHHTHDCW